MVCKNRRREFALTNVIRSKCGLNSSLELDVGRMTKHVLWVCHGCDDHVWLEVPHVPDGVVAPVVNLVRKGVIVAHKVGNEAHDSSQAVVGDTTHCTLCSIEKRRILEKKQERRGV